LLSCVRPVGGPSIAVQLPLTNNVLPLTQLAAIATPILLPVMQNFGVDPLHFGMIMLFNLGIGLCHPPSDRSCSLGARVGKVTIEQAMRKIRPFFALMFGVLMLVTCLPAISLWLPQHVLR
jgi:TRAP-type C4-dicarboxylate transport system permease large subunit